MKLVNKCLRYLKLYLINFTPLPILFPFLKTIKDELEAQKKKEKILGVRGYGWFNLKLDHFFFSLVCCQMNFVFQSSPSIRNISSYYPPQNWSHGGQSQRKITHISVLQTEIKAPILYFHMTPNPYILKRKKKNLLTFALQ